MSSPILRRDLALQAPRTTFPPRVLYDDESRPRLPVARNLSSPRRQPSSPLRQWDTVSRSSGSIGKKKSNRGRSDRCVRGIRRPTNQRRRGSTTTRCLLRMDLSGASATLGMRCTVKWQVNTTFQDSVYVVKCSRQEKERRNKEEEEKWIEQEAGGGRLVSAMAGCIKDCRASRNYTMPTFFC